MLLPGLAYKIPHGAPLCSFLVFNTCNGDLSQGTLEATCRRWQNLHTSRSLNDYMGDGCTTNMFSYLVLSHDQEMNFYCFEPFSVLNLLGVIVSLSFLVQMPNPSTYGTLSFSNIVSWNTAKATDILQYC